MLALSVLCVWVLDLLGGCPPSLHRPAVIERTLELRVVLEPSLRRDGVDVERLARRPDREELWVQLDKLLFAFDCIGQSGEVIFCGTGDKSNIFGPEKP